MIVDDATLREAAFQLLASSTGRRYVREAARIASESGLVDALRNDASKRARARDRAAELVPELCEGERSPAEFEEALLLCALARTEDDGGVASLERARVSGSAWTRSLAHRLLALRPATPKEIDDLQLQLGSVLDGEGCA